MPEMKVISRSEWGARHGRGNDVSSKMPWGEVVVHTEAGAIRKEDWPEIEAWAALNISLTEVQKVRAIESFHVNTRGWNGIAYSFLFFPDGTIAEGRGWGRSGGHTEGRNSTAAGFCLLGHGDKQPATEAQWQAMRWLIGEGIRLGKLKPNPKITGHRNYSLKGKTCPGNLVYPHIGRLRGITGPIDIFEDGELIMEKAVEDRFKAIEGQIKTQNDLLGKILQGVFSDEATDEVEAGKERIRHGSLRGWIVALAKKSGVTQAEAEAEDTSK
jgi:hypothetical protein